MCFIVYVFYIFYVVYVLYVVFVAYPRSEMAVTEIAITELLKCSDGALYGLTFNDLCVSFFLSLTW